MTVSFVFWGEESVYGISFYPIRLDFAAPEVAIFPLQ